MLYVCMPVGLWYWCNRFNVIYFYHWSQYILRYRQIQKDITLFCNQWQWKRNCGGNVLSLRIKYLEDDFILILRNFCFFFSLKAIKMSLWTVKVVERKCYQKSRQNTSFVAQMEAYTDCNQAVTSSFHTLLNGTSRAHSGLRCWHQQDRNYGIL